MLRIDNIVLLPIFKSFGFCVIAQNKKIFKLVLLCENMRYRWRRWMRRQGPGRPPSEFFLFSLPRVKQFMPTPCLNPEPISLTYAEYEVLRLTDLEELNQEKAAKKMKTSRATVWRLLNGARKKVAQALTESRPLIVVRNVEK